jgi:hypothetical protein
MIDWVLALPKVLALKFKEKVHELEEANSVSYITSIERLGHDQDLQQGRREEDFVIAKRMLAKRLKHNLIKEITGLSDQDLISLED